MEIRWRRILWFLAFIFLLVGALRLYKSADDIQYRWHSMIEWMSGTFRDNPTMGIIYLILFFGTIGVILWLLSRVARWFRR